MKERKIKSERITSILTDKFKEARQEKNLSYSKLSYLTGLHRTTIGLIENKKRTPTIVTCLKIALALEIPLTDLIKIASEES